MLLNFNIRPITVDKRGIKDFPKLPFATSFIRKPLSEMLGIKITINVKVFIFKRKVL